MDNISGGRGYVQSSSTCGLNIFKKVHLSGRGRKELSIIPLWEKHCRSLQKLFYFIWSKIPFIQAIIFQTHDELEILWAMLRKWYPLFPMFCMAKSLFCSGKPQNHADDKFKIGGAVWHYIVINSWKFHENLFSGLRGVVD